MKITLFIFLIILSTNIFPETDAPHPIIDNKYNNQYTDNLAEMDLSQLKKYRDELHSELHTKNRAFDNRDLDKELLNALLTYDDERVKITKVIDKIIIDYKVNNEIKKILLSYKDTFDMTIKENRHLVKTLRDYKAYDFRLGASYLSMMTALQSTESTRDFYKILVRDKENQSTSIGKYTHQLGLSYKLVLQAKENINKKSEIDELNAVLKNVELEISKR